MPYEKINPKVYHFLDNLGKATKRLEEKKTTTDELKYHLKKIKSLSSEDKKHELSKELKKLENRVFESVEKGQKRVKISPEVRLRVEKLKDELDRVKEKYDKRVIDSEEKIKLLNERIKIYADKIKHLNRENETKMKKSENDKVDMYTVKKQISGLEKRYNDLKESGEYTEEEIKPLKERLEMAKQRLESLEHGPELKEEKHLEMPEVTEKIELPKMETEEQDIIFPDKTWLEEPKPGELKIPHIESLKAPPEPLPPLDKSEISMPESPQEPTKKKSFFPKFKLFKKKKS